MDDIKYKMKKAKRQADNYDHIDDEQELMDVADLIVENKLLID
jgi:hypothetical protein